MRDAILKTLIYVLVFTLYSIFLGAFLSVHATASAEERWTESELESIKSLWLNSLEALPSDPSNWVADDERAALLGQKLFFDTRMSSNALVSCATCHAPEKEFQDGLALGKGVGTTNRRTMPITGSAYSPFLFWDGRKDSQWAQALGPLESDVEHGGSRGQYAHLIQLHYRDEYEAIFGGLPDLEKVPPSAGPVADPVASFNWRTLPSAIQDAITEIFVNIGKVLAAYERRVRFTRSRFDEYVEALLQDSDASRTILTTDELRGLRLFIGKANCLQCHNGPLFTNQEFHNTGVRAVAGLPLDEGRLSGASKVLADEFNCSSRWSDSAPSKCLELKHMVTQSHELERAFKVPTLRNVGIRAPYMHAGQFATLQEVLRHYNKAPDARDGHSELKPLNLKEREIAQLVAFLHTLESRVDAPVALPN